MHPAILAGVAAGGAGSLMSGISSMLGGGGGSFKKDTGAGRIDYLFGEKKSPWSHLPYLTGGALKDAWKKGILPAPLQRSLQAYQPIMQAMYTGTSDQATRGATAAREDVARRYAEAGLTGPQLTKAMSDIDLTMRMADLAGQRQAKTGYASALSDMWKSIYQQGFDEMKALMGMTIGQVGGGQPTTASNILAGAGNMLGGIGQTLYNFPWGYQAGAPDYSAAIGEQFGEGWNPQIPGVLGTPSIGGGYYYGKNPASIGGTYSVLP